MTEAAISCLPLRGFEVDSLLAFLAHLGLLRSLEAARPEWRPRTSWTGPPWRAQLAIGAAVSEAEVARAAAEGIEALAARFDADGRANVGFTGEEFRSYAKRVQQDPVGGRLAAALTAEWPETKKGTLQAAPLVMMFGAGHQNFLDRLVAVPRGELPSRLRNAKRPPDMRDPVRIAEALFAPWRRADDADGFRWDPEEDQRYALRFDNPSKAGAAPTVHGANRLAAIGFLSFPCLAGSRRITTPGTARESGGRVSFLWPVWTVPLSLHGVENLLVHPELVACRLDKLRPFGVAEIYRARRVNNDRYMNVTRAAPVSGDRSGQ